MDWKTFLDEEKKKDYFLQLMDKINEEYQNYTCYPAYQNIFHAFEMTKLDDVKVVILGQDPYH